MAVIDWSSGLGAAPMAPAATWAFWARIAASTSLVVRFRPSILSGSSQMRIARSAENTVAPPTPSMRRISPATLRLR